MNRRRRPVNGRINKRSNSKSNLSGSRKTDAGNVIKYNKKFMNDDGTFKTAAIEKEMMRRGAPLRKSLRTLNKIRNVNIERVNVLDKKKKKK